MLAAARAKPLAALLVAVSLALALLGAPVESRAVAAPGAHNQRKPPFNGSIFGKRAVLSPLVGVSQADVAQSPLDLVPIPVEGDSYAMLAQQQQPQRESFIRAVIEQCLSSAPEMSLAAGSWCSDLLARLSNENGNWLNQLMSRAR